MSKNDPRNALRALRGVHEPFPCCVCGKTIKPLDVALTRNDIDFCCSDACEHKKWPGGRL
jgi:hypothetical protein